MVPESLFDFRRWRDLSALLLTVDPLADRLTRYLCRVQEMLQSTTVTSLLEATFERAHDVDFLRSAAAAHVHFGFLCPRESAQQALPFAASAAGFGTSQRSFPSTIMARELGPLLGQRRVPTTVFKAFARPGNGRTLSIEAFLPDVTPPVLAGWIEGGIGAHFGISMKDLLAVARAFELCVEAGFDIPESMRAHLATNPGEDVTAFYADGSTSAGRIRLEFFHSGNEVDP